MVEKDFETVKYIFPSLAVKPSCPKHIGVDHIDYQGGDL